MKLWWVFAYDQYCPGGGLSDLKGCFASEEEANEFAEFIRQDHDYVEVENIMKIATEEFEE